MKSNELDQELHDYYRVLEELFPVDRFTEQTRWLEKHGFRPVMRRDQVNYYEYYRENGNLDAVKITVVPVEQVKGHSHTGNYRWKARIDSRTTCDTPDMIFPEFSYGGWTRLFDSPQEALLDISGRIRDAFGYLNENDNDGSKFEGSLEIRI